MVQVDASLPSMKRLASVPRAALVLSLVLGSLHSACLAGRTVSFILSHTGKGKGGTEGGEKKEDSLARVGPAKGKRKQLFCI